MASGTEPHCAVVSNFTVFFAIFWITIVSAQQGWDDYFRRWEQQPYAERMYPFGADFMDTEHNNDNGFDARINFAIPYAARTFTHVWVDVAGYIELSLNVTDAVRTPVNPLTRWPNKNFPTEGDPPIIAPYYAQFLVRGWEATGRIYWRRLDEKEHEGHDDHKEITRHMLEWTSAEVRAQVLGGEQFSATHGLVITWHDLTFSGCTAGDNQCPRNTVQLVLVTDGRATFAIYNYYDLTWVGGHSQLCDTTTGLTTVAFPNCFQAQAGFNLGDARGFVDLPLSATDQVVNLDEKSATGIQGRFIYMVSGERIRRGGCTNDTEIEGDRWPVEVYPSLGDMVGGYPVYISGPCVREEHNIKVMIGETEVEGRVAPGSGGTRTEIIMPNMNHVGNLIVRISTDGGNTFWNHRHYKLPIVPYHRARPRVRLDNDDGRWFTREPDMLGFHWMPCSLVNFWERWANETRPEQFLVDIYLLGYFERPDEFKGEWKKVHTLAEAVPNSGYHEFTVSEHQCEEDCDWGVPHPVGFIKIVRHNPEEEKRKWQRAIKSTPFPLGWYVNDYMEENHGEEWAVEMCQEWYDRDREDQRWREELQACPTTLNHAHVDIGRFMVDADCEDDANVEVCITEINQYILGADCREGVPCPKSRCFQQTMSGGKGAATTCCYDRDNGNLLFSGDMRATSPSNRQSLEGLPPVLPPPIEPHWGRGVPSLSHWVWDSMMKVFCCNYTAEQSEQYCKRRHDIARPTTDIGRYQPPKYAISYGDPHFETFDGNDYTFNGRGEYWLVRVRDMENRADNFNLQARLVQPDKQIWGKVNATVITALAMQEGDNPNDEYVTVEFLINYKDAQKEIITLVDGEIMDFGEPELITREFHSAQSGRRVLIHCNDKPNDIRQSNFTVSFESGVGVQVSSQNNVLHVIAVLTAPYWGKTYGLYGHWDDDLYNDFITPDGTVIDPNMGNEHLHHNFGETWVIDREDSRFTYRALMTFDWFRDPTFRPHWGIPPMPPNEEITEEDVEDLCKEVFVCTYDFKTTLHRGLAAMTLEMQQWMHIVENLTTPIPACGRLAPPMAEHVFDHYLVGGTVEFTGCSEDYELRGETLYECVKQEDGTAAWEPEPDITCISPAQISAERTQMALLIALPIILAVILTIIGVAAFMIYKKRKQEQQQAGSGKPNYPANVNNSSGGAPQVCTIPFPQTDVSQGLAGQGEVAGVASKTSSRTTTPEPYYKSPHPTTFTNPTLIKDASQDSINMYTPDTPSRVDHSPTNSFSPSFSMATPQTDAKQSDRGSATGSNLSGSGGMGSPAAGHDNRAMIGDGDKQVSFHTAQGQPSVWKPQGNQESSAV